MTPAPPRHASVLLLAGILALLGAAVAFTALRVGAGPAVAVGATALAAVGAAARATLG